MTTLRVVLSPRAWLVLSLVLGVLPLCLSSTEMWDGVVVVHSLATRDWPVIKSLAFDSNWYLTYGIFLLAEMLHDCVGLPYVVFFKTFLVFLIVGIALELYLLARRVFKIPETIALWLPPLVFSFPIWYVLFSYTSLLGHMTCVWLGLVGYRLLHQDKKLTLTLGMLLVGMSFQLASNCTFLLALELGLWVVSKNKTQWPYWRSILLLLLALAVFAVTRVIWPPVGTYVGYNRFLNPFQLASWLSYAKYSALFATWLLLLLPMTLSVWWALRQERKQSQHKLTHGLLDVLIQRWKMVIVFFLLVSSACLPYIAVGLGSPLFTATVPSPGSVSAVLASNSAVGPISVWYGGWGVRHLLLMMIALMLLAAWLASEAQTLIAPKSTTLHKTLGGAFVATVCINLAFCLPGHWAKLSRIAKEQSVVRLLASNPPLPHGKVDLLLDPREDYLSYIYETNYLLYLAYKSTHWASLMLPEVAAVQAWGEEHRKLTLDVPVKVQPVIASLNVMRDYRWTDDCKTVARIALPIFSVWDILWRAEHAPTQLPHAQVTPISSTCPNTNPFWQAR